MIAMLFGLGNAQGDCPSRAFGWRGGVRLALGTATGCLEDRPGRPALVIIVPERLRFCSVNAAKNHRLDPSLLYDSLRVGLCKTL